MAAQNTKTMLSIEQKLKLLDYAKENPKESCRTLSTKFIVGKTQIAAVLKNETELRAAYATYRGDNPGNNKRAGQGRYQEINEALYKWFSLARESLVPVNGSMLQEEAAEIAKQLAKPEYAEFKASSGWLEKWKNAYGISQRSIEGESGEVPIQTIEAWMEGLPEICGGYNLEDIWNMNESGCSFVHCQTDVFRKKGGVAREANTQKFV